MVVSSKCTYTENSVNFQRIVYVQCTVNVCTIQGSFPKYSCWNCATCGFFKPFSNSSTFFQFSFWYFYLLILLCFPRIYSWKYLHCSAPINKCYLDPGKCQHIPLLYCRLVHLFINFKIFLLVVVHYSKYALQYTLKES